MKPEDVHFFNENCKASTSDPDYNPFLLHIFYKNEQVDKHNNYVLNLLENQNVEMEVIIAKDSFVDSTFVNDGTKAKILLGLKAKHKKDTAQLSYKIQLGKQCRISLTTNINVKDGLVNGAMGTVMNFTKTSSGHVHII